MDESKEKIDKNRPFRIFKNEDYIKDGFVKELSWFGLACFYLAIAVDAAEGNNDALSEAAFRLADDVGYHGESWAYNTLRNSAMVDVVTSYDVTHMESRYYTLFEKHLTKVLGESSKIIKGRSDAKNKPDAWIEISGEEIPVEMKKGCFDAKALRQLQRYMTAFNSKLGIAVGMSMTVDCPSNVIFVETSSLEYWESLETKKITLDEILAK